MAKFPFFQFAGLTPPRPVVGLFVAWRTTPVDATKGQFAPPKAADIDGGEGSFFRLGFTGAEGRLYPVTSGKNPWGLINFDELGPTGNARKDTPKTAEDVPIQLAKFTVDALLIAHPSPTYAMTLVDRLNGSLGPGGEAGKFDDWAKHLKQLKPKLQPFVLELPKDAASYFPPGHADLGGFCLYRMMPTAPLSAVQKATQKLAETFGQLGYAAGAFSTGDQDPLAENQDPTRNFSPVLQANVHHFQQSVAAEQAATRTPAGSSAPDATWGMAMTQQATGVGPQTVVAADSASVEAGFVGAEVFATIANWKTQGFVHPGKKLVRWKWPLKKRTFWGTPELAVAFVGWSETCRALGLLYDLALSNTMRSWSASGGGQIKNSNHKLGLALDLETGSMFDAGPGLPVAFEAQYASASHVEWQLYGHAESFGLDNLSTKLEIARANTRKFLEELMGDAPEDVGPMLRPLETAHAKLTAAAVAQLKNDFFRDRVSRFRHQSGQQDGGEIAKPVSAEEDKARNSFAIAGTPDHWLNIWRVAFLLGLHRIRSHSTFGAVNVNLAFVPTEASAQEKEEKQKEPWGWLMNPKTPEQLDQLAEGIRLAGELGGGVQGIHVLRPEDAASLESRAKARKTEVTDSDRLSATQSIDPKLFDLDTIKSWLRRASDNADVPGLVSGQMKLNRLDLTITWPIEGSKRPMRDAILNYLRQRTEVSALVSHLGAGLGLPNVDEGNVLKLPDLARALSRASPRGGSDLTLVLRPRFIREDAGADLTNVDPTQLGYRIVRTFVPQNLEWWHYELAQEGKPWLVRADERGFAKGILARQEDVAADSAGPWVPGWAVTEKFASLSDSGEPNNQPGSIESRGGEDNA